MSIVRDYIPEGESPTPQEEALRAAARARVQGGIIRDFIPGPGHKTLPPSGRDRQAEEALQRALQAMQAANRQEYREMVKRLKKLTVGQAIDYITTLPFSVMELALVAETLNGRRKSILERFPTPDPDVVERYRHIDEANPDEASASDGSAKE